MGYVKLNLIKHQKRIPRVKPDEELSSVNLCKGSVKDEDGSRRGVLVEGVPGSGQTTLVKRICSDWSKGWFAQDSKAVIQVVLRSLPKRDKLAIEDMVLTSIADDEEAADIAQYVRDYQGDGVVFILHGFDEMSVEMRQSSSPRHPGRSSGS